jgi:2-isopropylmalate synthase
VEEDAQVKALLEAETPVVTIVGKTSPLHVEHVFKVTLEENIAMIRDTVAYLKKHGREVLYDAEHFFDTYKTWPDYALASIRAAAEAGADLIVLCETNGGNLPGFISDTTRAAVAALGKPVGIHTHNDCGLGVANALAAVEAGANQVQGTINGYGERVGNCNLITTIANLQLKLGIPSVDDLTKLRELSYFVAELANVAPDIREPFVGEAAFTHKGGLHVDAVQKLSSSYEHIDPAEVGNSRIISVSDMSGQANILARAEALGTPLKKGSDEVKAVLTQVKQMESEGYEFEAAEASFSLLLRKLTGRYEPLFELLEYHCTYRYAARGVGHPGEERWDKCEATVKLRAGGEVSYQVAEGDGPINAVDAALRKAIAPSQPGIHDIRLEDYKVRIINGQSGSAARTRVHITSTDGDTTWSTVGVSDNVIHASWLALVDSFEYKLGGV